MVFHARIHTELHCRGWRAVQLWADGSRSANLVLAIAVLVRSLQGFTVSISSRHRLVDPHWRRGMPETALVHNSGATATTAPEHTAGYCMTISMEKCRPVRAMPLLLPCSCQSDPHPHLSSPDLATIDDLIQDG